MSEEFKEDFSNIENTICEPPIPIDFHSLVDELKKQIDKALKEQITAYCLSLGSLYAYSKAFLKLLKEINILFSLYYVPLYNLSKIVIALCLKSINRFLSFLEDTIEFACSQSILNKLLLPRKLVSDFNH